MWEDEQCRTPADSGHQDLIAADARARNHRQPSPGYLDNGGLSVERATKATWYDYADP